MSEILAYIGGLTGFAATLWVLLRFMKGIPLLIVQWSIAACSIIVTVGLGTYVLRAVFGL